MAVLLQYIKDWVMSVKFIIMLILVYCLYTFPIICLKCSLFSPCDIMDRQAFRLIYIYIEQMSRNFKQGIPSKIPRIACGGRSFLTIVLPIERP
jgi:hypothetical protein